MSKTLYSQNDNTVEIDEAYDVISGTYLNSGTATFRVLATDKTTEVLSAQTMDYVSSSNGRYRGLIDSGDVPAKGAYFFEFKIVEGGAQAVWIEPGVVLDRTG